MTTTANPGELKPGTTYLVTETFEATFKRQSDVGSRRLYFDIETTGEYVWVDPDNFVGATEVQVADPLWPPLAGELWESPDGERKFARLDGQRIYLCGSSFGDFNPVEITPSHGWKPVLTERS